MKIVLIFIGILAAVSGTIYFLSPDKTPASISFDVFMAFESGACQKDAVLTVNKQSILGATNGEKIAVLANKSPIYLCTKHGNHQRVVFPQNGTHSDCSVRTINPCLTGFVILPFKTMVLG